MVKRIEWNDFKNELLRIERSICFEDVLQAIQDNNLLATEKHQTRPTQNIYIVKISNYAYLVPYVEDEEKIFLKTIIPSRKATKKYLKGEES